MKCIKLFLCALCITLFVIPVFAQNGGGIVKGVVTDAKTHEPIPFASVMVKGTKNGVAASANGEYSISVLNLQKSILLFSSVGYKDLEIQIDGQTTINAELTPDTVLDEIMVVAFSTQTKKSFTGSAAVVGSKDISKKIATNVANALVGAVPGLQLTGASGQPGASQGNIHIRGISSMSASTSPLIIVDGAPYSASLSNIPADDIENITVLKDASSAALYGARGASGVILITTKSGDINNSKINAEVKFGITQRAQQDYETFTDPGAFMEAYYTQFFNKAFYGEGKSKEAANKWANEVMLKGKAGLTYNPFSVPKGETLIGLDGKLNPNASLGNVYEKDGISYYITPDNWKDHAYRQGLRKEYNVSISGGAQKFNYYTSVGFLDEKGVLMNSGYNRFNARFKADYKVKNFFRSYVNVGYVHSQMESNPNLSTTKSDAGNTSYFTQYIAPIYPIFVRTLDKNGKPVINKDIYGHNVYDFGAGYQGLVRPFLNTGNPIGANLYNENMVYRDQVQGQINFDINIAKNLKFTSNNSLNFDLLRGSYYGNPFVGPTASTNGQIYKDANCYYNQNYVQTLNYNKTFAGHEVQVMLGHEWYKSSSALLGVNARGGFSPEVKEINAFSNIYDGNSSSSMYNVEGYFANINYNYAQRYFLQASYRRDASSKFDKKHRWGDFWSIGGAWLVNNEPFFQKLNLSWVDNLKLKASIGQQGNDGIPSFNYVDRYSLSKGENKMLPSFTYLGNPKITWETTTNFNIGLEFAVLKNRLIGELNVYDKKTTSLLFWLNLPESMGIRGYYDNIGDLRNRGIEFSLTTDLIRTQNVVWTLSGNISSNTTKILKLDQSKTKQYGGYRMADVAAGFNVSMWYTVGGSLYTAMLPDYAGIDDKGNALYWVDKDIYEEQQAGKLSNSSKPATNRSFTTTDWTKASYYTTEMLPLANGGLNSSLQAFGFDANITFDYQIGGKIYDFGYASLMSPVTDNASGANLHVDVLKSWTPNNTSTNIPRFMFRDNNVTSQSSRFLTSASYLNFQSFVVGYTLPSKITKKALLSKVRLYVQGDNLMFWSVRKGLDPRFSFQGTSASGIAAYAPVRTFMAGLQVTF